MRFCPTCGIPIDEGTTSCARCGTPFAAPVEPERRSAPAANLPIPENIVAVLSYLLVPAVVFLLLEPYRRNRFVRFHSFQCLFTVAGLIAASLVLSLVSAILRLIPFFGVFLVLLFWPLFALAVFVLWLLLEYKAYLHEVFKLPFVGDMAERQANAV